VSDPRATELLRLRAAAWDRGSDLPFYPLLVDVLRGHLETRRRIGVLHVELDDVDLVESLYGWQAFDALTSRLGAGLRAGVGAELPESAILAVARVPADRFVVFLPATHASREPDATFLASAAAALSERLDRALAAEDLAAFAPRARSRIGFAMLSENPFYRFERRVHAAVEEARAHPDRREAERERVFRAEIHRIVRDGAVSMVFQPVVRLDSREVVGVEAFARGPRESAFEAPRALFAAGDRFGAATDLDRLCRETAFADADLDRVPGRIFVNTRPECLSDPLRLGPPAPFPRSRIVIELSERAIADDVARVAASRDALRDAGFSLCLDDVGTGYESLLTLERVRPDFVKVDPLLVRGIDGSFIRQELFGSLVDASRRLGADLVAVGVETEEEAAVVLSLGARLAQGFAFGRPMSLPELLGGSSS
jgi:EAL domain-containing protein (putative c-di-GMP-specific phosphodiesterase class I)